MCLFCCCFVVSLCLVSLCFVLPGVAGFVVVLFVVCCFVFVLFVVVGYVVLFVVVCRMRDCVVWVCECVCCGGFSFVSFHVALCCCGAGVMCRVALSCVA